MTDQADLSDDLVAALRLIAATELLLVALDFDGTLSPTVDNPSDARALPAARAALERLRVAPATKVALVSGRAMDSLEHVADAPDDVILSGSHGAEFRVDGELIAPELTDDERARLDPLREALERAAAIAPRAWVEVKAVGFALHTRRSDAHDALEANELARRLTSRMPGLTVRVGKNVLEFSVVDATKGGALRRLRQYTGATGILFAGDDVTDEDGFAALGADDLALKVGDGESLARYRVADVAMMPSVLEFLADQRR